MRDWVSVHAIHHQKTVEKIQIMKKHLGLIQFFISFTIMTHGESQPCRSIAMNLLGFWLYVWTKNGGDRRSSLLPGVVRIWVYIHEIHPPTHKSVWILTGKKIRACLDFNGRGSIFFIFLSEKRNLCIVLKCIILDLCQIGATWRDFRIDSRLRAEPHATLRSAIAKAHLDRARASKVPTSRLEPLWENFALFFPPPPSPKCFFSFFEVAIFSCAHINFIIIVWLAVHQMVWFSATQLISTSWAGLDPGWAQ